MGLPVTLSPNFEDYSCEFKFGVIPVDLKDDPILQSPCFELCSSSPLKKGKINEKFSQGKIETMKYEKEKSSTNTINKNCPS